MHRGEIKSICAFKVGEDCQVQVRSHKDALRIILGTWEI
jgi:hypothetical protein